MRRKITLLTRFIHAHVFQGDGDFCDSFVIDNGRFVLTGSEEETLKAYPQASTVDLGGRFVCPGFNDSHMHLLGLGGMLGMAQLANTTDSLAHMLAALREFADTHPDEPFVLGRGWNQDFFNDCNRFPTREDLDRICPDRPCLITRACGHIAVVNSAALSLAGIADAPVAIEGGLVETDSSGRPTGVLSENAISLAASLIPRPSRETIKRRLVLAMDFVNRMGITSVQTDDFSTLDVPFEEIISAYLELKAEGRMTVRVTQQCLLPDLSTLNRFLQAGYRTGWGDEWFRLGPLKLLADGSLGARTALLRTPYADAPDTRGIAIYTQNALNALVLQAHQAGMQIAIHAIGDAAADMALNAFEQAQLACPRSDTRHGIVHAQILNHEQATRMKTLGLHAYIQSIFLDYDTQIVHARIGERAGEAYPASSLLDLGVTLSNGSDSPVELPNVLGGIQCAVTRRPFTRPFDCAYLPHEALTLTQALASFTSGGAYASFEEAEKGLIRKGQRADFTVLQIDPFKTDPQWLHKIPVFAVYLNGRPVI